MYNALSKIIADNSKLKTTENGATAYSRLDNPVLTLFAQAGALRSSKSLTISRVPRGIWWLIP